MMITILTIIPNPSISYFILIIYPLYLLFFGRSTHVVYPTLYCNAVRSK